MKGFILMNPEELLSQTQIMYLHRNPISTSDDVLNDLLMACQHHDKTAIAIMKKVLINRANEIILGESNEVFWFASEFSDVLTLLVEQDPKIILAFELISINRSNYVEKEKLSIIMRHLIKGAALALPYVRPYITKQKRHRFCLDTRYCVLLRLRLI